MSQRWQAIILKKILCARVYLVSGNNTQHKITQNWRLRELNKKKTFHFSFYPISRDHWDALLKSVRCEIISFTRNDQIDAYVLRWVDVVWMCNVQHEPDPLSGRISKSLTKKKAANISSLTFSLDIMRMIESAAPKTRARRRPTTMVVVKI